MRTPLPELSCPRSRGEAFSFRALFVWWHGTCSMLECVCHEMGIDEICANENSTLTAFSVESNSGIDGGPSGHRRAPHKNPGLSHSPFREMFQWRPDLSIPTWLAILSSSGGPRRIIRSSYSRAAGASNAHRSPRIKGGRHVRTGGIALFRRISMVRFRAVGRLPTYS
jgi:hypothetical protein